MSPRYCSCVICGKVIHNFEQPLETSWINQFRILYSQQDKVYISGVGIYLDRNYGRFEVPLNFDARWTTTECTDIGVCRFATVEGRYGYLFHEACWELLTEAYAPRSVPQERLYEVCRSLVESTWLVWGHDYQGLLSGESWQDVWAWPEYNDDFTKADADPLASSEFQTLLGRTSEHPPDLEVPPRGVAEDCFSKLPLEMITAIACQMSTEDALNIRLASAAFWPVFESQTFWATRFQPHAERAWLYEARHQRSARDWRYLYRNTCHLSSQLENRARVWELIEQVQSILTLEQPVRSLSMQPVEHSPKWTEIAGSLQCVKQPLREGCRTLFEQFAMLPDTGDWTLHISTVEVGLTTYIAGLRIQFNEMPDIQLGYRSVHEHAVSLSGLQGFIIAIAPTGITGIQAISSDGQVSQRIGNWDSIPQSRRLDMGGSVTGIKLGYDGCKLTSFGVSTSAEDQSRSMSRADNALWYGQMPDVHSDLHEAEFRGLKDYLVEYEPLYWVHFGGPKGIYLKHITGVAVSLNLQPIAIQFIFDNDDVPLECRYLKCRPGALFDIDDEFLADFAIDGPGGEHITAVKVISHQFNRKSIDGSTWPVVKPPILTVAFEVTTNRGRHCHFQDPDVTDENMNVFEDLVVAKPGEALTGLYTCENDIRMPNLGVISEVM